MAEVKWIKITTDMFDNRKIKHLRKLPEGNSIVLIWVMLLTMAGRCNSSGMIFLTENIPYTPKMLADELDFEESTVSLALQALENFNMIVTDNGVFTIAGWEEYQNIEGMDKIREQNRIRQAKYKQKQKLLQESNVIGNVTVTEGNATDIEEDKEREEDNNIMPDSDESDHSKSETCKIIISYLNEKAGTSYKATSKKTQSLINARMTEGFSVDDFKTVIDKKCTDWLETAFAEYLRPTTLFGTKFESYLNAPTKQKLQKQQAETPDFLKKWSV